MINIAEEALELVEKYYGNNPEGQQYINRVIRVSARLKNKEAKAIALLKTIIEKTPINAEDLEMFGYPKKVIDAISLLTKVEGESYEDCVERIVLSNNRQAMTVELAFIEDTLDEDSCGRLEEVDEKILKEYQSRLIESLNI